MNKFICVLFVFLLFVVVLVGCLKKVKEELVVLVDIGILIIILIGLLIFGLYGLGDLDIDVCLCQCVVYFDLDKEDVKLEFQVIMVCYVKYLCDCLFLCIILQGYIDECGLCVYNQVLGECCGNGVSLVLQVNGGLVLQLIVVFYGEECLVCIELNEFCWLQNCCVEIVYIVQ